jgi:hypothetical protein
MSGDSSMIWVWQILSTTYRKAKTTLTGFPDSGEAVMRRGGK